MGIARGIGVVLLAAVTAAPPAHGESCSPKQSEAALGMVGHLDEWTKLEAMFKKFSTCDDGAVAEGISEAVMRLLVDHWQTLPQLARLTERNEPFKRFVLDHMDATVDPADLARVEQLSSASCPHGMTRLCRELKAAAARTLKREGRAVR